MQQEEYDESLYAKYQKGSHSGYLADEYETTNDFPRLPEHYFRIQDDATIIELQSLQKQSQPMENISYPKGNIDFQMRMDSLLKSLDSQVTQKIDLMQDENSESS